MADITSTGTALRRAASARRGSGLRWAALAAAGLAGVAWGASRAGIAAGTADDLARLLRFMALLKGAMALAAAAGVAWRLRDPAPLPWLAAYLAATAAAGAGPGLIWGLAHVGLGAVLLHGGLLAMLVLLWRDPAVSARLADLLAARRRTLARRAGGPLSGAGAPERPAPRPYRSRPAR